MKVPPGFLSLRFYHPQSPVVFGLVENFSTSDLPHYNGNLVMKMKVNIKGFRFEVSAASGYLPEDFTLATMMGVWKARKVRCTAHCVTWE